MQSSVRVEPSASLFRCFFSREVPLNGAASFVLVADRVLVIVWSGITCPFLLVFLLNVALLSSRLQTILAQKIPLDPVFHVGQDS